MGGEVLYESIIVASSEYSLIHWIPYVSAICVLT